MRTFLIAALAALICGPAFGQTVIQSGTITPGHPSSFVSSGVIRDAGSATNGFMTELGIFRNGGLADCVTASTIARQSFNPASSPYTQMCNGVTMGGPGVITLNSYNGAAPGTLEFLINGATYTFPGTSPGGNVTGPNTSGTGNASIWNNTTGTLLADAGAPPVLRMASVAALRTNTVLAGNANVAAWYAGGTAGGGDFQYISTDTTSSDNSCTIIVDAASHRWYRQLQGLLQVTQCGAKGDGTTDDTTAIQAAQNAALAVFYPGGNYEACGIVLQPAAILQGVGHIGGGVTNTLLPTSVIQCKTANTYVFTLDNTNRSSSIQGVRFSDLSIFGDNAGVRINDPANGLPAPFSGGTQGYIGEVSFNRVYINNTGTIPTGTGVQMSVCFHCTFDSGQILGFAKNIDAYYSDFLHITNSRIWQFGTCDICLTSMNSFGNKALIANNDLLFGYTGATTFISDNFASSSLVNNVFEQQPTQGTGLVSAISSSGAEVLNITGNSIDFPSTNGANWLNVTTSTGFLLFNISNNDIGGGTLPIFNAGAGFPLFTGGGNSVSVFTHSGNGPISNGSGGEIGFPLSSVGAFQMGPLPSGTVSILTPGLSGSLSANNYGGSAYAIDNALIIPPAAGSGSNLVTFQDPRYNLTGTYQVNALIWADGAQAMGAGVNDNGSSVANVTLNVTTVPTWYQVNASKSYSTKLQVTFNNSSLGGSNNVHIVEISVSNP